MGHSKMLSSIKYKSGTELNKFEPALGSSATRLNSLNSVSGHFLLINISVCHTIATTKLNWCEKIDEDFTEDGDLDIQAVNYARELQKVETEAHQVKYTTTKTKKEAIYEPGQERRGILGLRGFTRYVKKISTKFLNFIVNP